MVFPPCRARAPSLGVPPVRAAHSQPPGRLRRAPDDVTWVRVEHGVKDTREAEPLGLGQVSGGVGELGEVRHGDASRVDRERGGLDEVEGLLPVGADPVAMRVAHSEDAAGQRDLLYVVPACRGSGLFSSASAAYPRLLTKSHPSHRCAAFAWSGLVLVMVTMAVFASAHHQWGWDLPGAEAVTAGCRAPA